METDGAEQQTIEEPKGENLEGDDGPAVGEARYPKLGEEDDICKVDAKPLSAIGIGVWFAEALDDVEHFDGLRGGEWGARRGGRTDLQQAAEAETVETLGGHVDETLWDERTRHGEQEKECTGT
jgi:hypothetical protein